MTEQQSTDAPIGPVDTPSGRRFRLRRPRRSITWGFVAGASFTGGYLIMSFLYCQGQIGCTISPFWLVVIALLGAGVGALWGWVCGKFLRFFYRMTRVD